MSSKLCIDQFNASSPPLPAGQPPPFARHPPLEQTVEHLEHFLLWKSRSQEGNFLT